jgi:hypothetical protein
MSRYPFRIRSIPAAALCAVSLGGCSASRDGTAYEPEVPGAYCGKPDGDHAAACGQLDGGPSGGQQQASTAANNPVGGANPLLTPASQAALTTAITAQQTGTLIRAAVVPASLLHTQNPDNSIVNDLQFSLAADTTASSGGAKTTFAAGTDLYNPFSQVSNHAAAIRDECFQSEFHPNEDRTSDTCSKIPDDCRGAFDKEEGACEQEVDLVPLVPGNCSQYATNDARQACEVECSFGDAATQDSCVDALEGCEGIQEEPYRGMCLARALCWEAPDEATRQACGGCPGGC